MENTIEAAQTISESVINGQHKQALQQFADAWASGCSAADLLDAIAEQIGAGLALIRIAAAYIDGGF